MADADYDHVPLDLDSDQARVALAAAFKLVTAARGAAAEGTPQAWTDYELEVNRAVREILTDPLEQTVDRLAWALHGLATIAAHYAGLASRTGAIEIDATIQWILETRTRSGER
jgi:hypothetical protein